MNDIDIIKYITDGKLDYSILWKELAEMTGFRAEERRGYRMKEVQDAYNHWKITKDNKDADRPTGLEDEVLHKTNDKVPVSLILSEDYIITYLNREAKSDFISTKDDKYCHYDAEEPRYIAEIKVRNKHYDDCIIEYDKYMSNLGTSAIEGKEFLYIVATKSNIYVFNITKLHEGMYPFGWIKKELPVNSHFGGYNDKKMKRIGYINIKDASVCYNHKP